MIGVIGVALMVAGLGMIAFGARQKWRECHPPRISLLVPFHSDKAEREANWNWLHAYWKQHLPDAEIIVQDNLEVPFCKTAAVNAAFRRSHGDVIAIVDADCFIDAAVIEKCAARIREARTWGERLWFIPYRRFYRLTGVATRRLMLGDLRPLTDPPVPFDHEHQHDPAMGHHYAALIQILPREAFEAVNGMDERFKGWGGEDVSFMYAVDTLYGKHRTIDAPVYHLWHPFIQGRWKFTRQWFGQHTPEQNDRLATKYCDARGVRAPMRELVAGGARRPHRHHHHHHHSW